MTLDASGNLLVGATSSPGTIWSSDRTFAYVKGSAANKSGEVIVESNNGNQQAAFFASGGTAEFGLWSTKASALVFGTNNTERARIDANGNLLVGTTGQITNEKLGVVQTGNAQTFVLNGNNTSLTSTVFSLYTNRNTSDNTYYVMQYYNSATGASRFLIADSGNVTNSNNSYGAISDVKVKENITDATPKLDKLNQVRVVNYNLIGEEQKQIGVIAQELEQIFPGMVEETADRDAEGNDLGTTTKSVKYSVFVPMLIKAIQELTARIEALENTQ
jgi:hypothetical protein